MTQPGTVLSAKQILSVQCLLTAKSVAAAAEKANVPLRTLFRWLGEREFQVALSRAEGEMIDAATRQLLQLQDEAIGVFSDILKDADATPALRLRAAESVLSFMLKIRELRNLESRLVALEQAIAGGTP